MAEKNFLPVIICGGAGTRLWPLSRETMPKQFSSLLGNESTFQRITALLTRIEGALPPLVITSTEYRFMVREQLEACHIDADIILEPFRRDSAAAVAIATEKAIQIHPDIIVGIFAADHLIQNDDLFLEAVQHAKQVAALRRIVTIGIPPTTPSSQYGYIAPGAAIPEYPKAHDVRLFVEKPQRALAEQYILNGFFWNSGNFIFHAQTMQDELEAFVPRIAKAVGQSLDKATRNLGFLALDPDAFAETEKKSIDYAVMEHTRLAAVIPGYFGWSDVGNWHAIWDYSEKDGSGNAISGRGYVLDGQNNLVKSEGSLVTLVGVNDLTVIATADAVLVIPTAQAEEVKHLVQHLQTLREPEATTHREAHRPWGKYICVDRGPGYQVKRITVKPGGQLSLQKHFHRAEHWVVVQGTADVICDNKKIILHENESVYIPIGSVHSLANPGKTPLDLIEVQVGSYLGEDDIIRYADIYSRA